MGGVDNELVDVEKRLKALLEQARLDLFVSVDTLKRWTKDVCDEDPMTVMKMLTGLLDEEQLDDMELFQNLIEALIRLSHLLPSKRLQGETFNDVLKEREKYGEPTNAYLTTTSLPPTEWTRYYHSAMRYMRNQEFLKASKEFDRTFEKLLETKTTYREIYRVFCNSGASYLFSGKPLLGLRCLEIAQELNPQYTFASDQLRKYERGDFDEGIEFGFLSIMKENLEEWEKRSDYLDLDVVMKWPEKKILDKLFSFGITIDTAAFIKGAKTVNQPGELAEKLFYPQLTEPREDEDFIWMAAYALWDIYCPDEPSISDFNDIIHEAFLFVSEFERKNEKNENKKAFEKICADYFKRVQAYLFTDKKDFLQEWQKTIEIDRDPCYELNTFLTSLFKIPNLEQDILEAVHHLNIQIPHPMWTGIEIIHDIIHNDSRLDRLYEKLKAAHPFYCYVAYDIAQYFLEKKDYSHAELYLMDALEIIDRRAEKNKLSLETTETTIYDDYSTVISLLEEVLEKSNADSKKKKLLNAKKQVVEKKSAMYSKSPKFEKLDNAMEDMFAQRDHNQAEQNNAFRYYNYLKKFDINFETAEPTETKENYVNIRPERHDNLRNLKEKEHSNEKFRPKIGRNDLCYCGSGKKYKKCCLDRDRKEISQ